MNHTDLPNGLRVFTHEGDPASLHIETDNAKGVIDFDSESVRHLWHVCRVFMQEQYPELWKKETHLPNVETLKCGVQCMEIDHPEHGQSVALLGFNARVAIALTPEHAGQVVVALYKWLGKTDAGKFADLAIAIRRIEDRQL